MAYIKSLINWHIPMAVFKKRCTKRDFLNLVIDWACFSLASFSLQRIWCRALISGCRTAPVCLERMTEWQSLSHLQWADLISCWPISLISDLTRLSLCLSLFGRCLFKLRETLLHMPASKVNVLKPRFPIGWRQCLRPSGPSCRQLYRQRNWGLPVGRFPLASSP